MTVLKTFAIFNHHTYMSSHVITSIPSIW